MAEDVVESDVHFDFVRSAVASEVEKRAKENVGVGAGTDEMVDVVERKCRDVSLVGGPVQSKRKRPTKRVSVASGEANCRQVVRCLMNREMQRARTVDED